MAKVNKRIKLLFWISLALSLGFPCGVLGIVFGAVKKIVFLLVIGIILTVGGFYVMPIMWVKYGEARQDRTMLFMIMNEHIYTVAGITAQTNFSEQTVRARINKMILNHELVGYLFIDDTLVVNTNRDAKEIPYKTKKCENCGAEMLWNGEVFVCEYCKSVFTE